MKLKKLILHNFRSYDHFEYDYTPGITGIMGPIYSGKSNFAELGNRFALTGLTPPGLTKKDLLKWHTSEGYTKVIFEHLGKEYTLTRNIHDGKIILETPDGEEKKENIDNTLSEIYGLPLKVFAEYCFIPQFQMTDIITGSRASRVDFMLKMAGVDKAGSIRQDLQTLIGYLPTFEDYSSEIDDLRSNIEVYEQKKAEKEKDLIMYEDTEKELEEVRQRLESLRGKPPKETYYARLSEYEQGISRMQSKLDRVAEKERIVPKEPLSYDEQLRLTWYSKGKSEYEKTESDKKEVEKELEQLKAVDAPDIDEMHSQLSDIKNKHDNIKEKISLISQGKCPTCSRDFENAQQQIDKLTAEKNTLAASFKKGKEVYVKHKEKSTARQKRISELTAAIATYSERLSRLLSSKGETALTQEELLLKQQEYKDYTERLAEYSDVTSETVQQLSSDITTKKAEMTAYSERGYLEDDVYADLSNTLVELEADKKKLDELNDDITSLRNNIALSTNSLKLKEDLQNKRKRNMEALQFMQRARDVFHRDNLPARVLEDRRQVINCKLRDLLKHMDAGYTPRLNKDFDFRIDFNTISDRPVKDLSGGQRVILAALFHLVKLELFTDVPFLVIDEPTLYLNKDDLSDIADMFRSYVESKGKDNAYIMIPTHEEELRACFTRTFTFDEHV